jgi:hypothetical protein
MWQERMLKWIEIEIFIYTCPVADYVAGTDAKIN